MHDADGVRGAERVAYLPEYLVELVGRDGAAATQERGEILALEQLHREPWHARRGVDAGAEHLHHVVALDQRADARLLLEALPQARVGEERRVHELHRAELAGAGLLGHVDRAHAAGAEGLDDPVLPAEDRAGFELR